MAILRNTSEDIPLNHVAPNRHNAKRGIHLLGIFRIAENYPHGEKSLDNTIVTM